MTSTKVIYHLEGEPTPYMVKILVSPDCVTLEDFKHHINPPNALDEYKYIFKTEDEDFGCVVKIEVHNDEAVLPKFENKVIAWLTGKTGTMRTNTAANSQTDLTSYNSGNSNSNQIQTTPNQINPFTHANSNTNSNTNSNSNTLQLPTKKIISSTPNTSQSDGIGNIQPSQNNNKNSKANSNSSNNNNSGSIENVSRRSAEKLSSAMKDLSIIKTSSTLPGIAAANSNEKSSFPPPPPPRGAKPKNKINNLRRFPSDSTLDSTMTDNTFCRGRKALENEFFDDESRYSSTMTGTTGYSIYKHRKKQRKKRLQANNALTDSVSTFSSMTDSTVSLNIIIATLDMTKYDTLGITLISDEGGGPVLVGYVFPNGAVAADGRIERGDIIIEINGISVEDKSTEDAVGIIRREAKNIINGNITMTVAKQPLFPTEAEIMGSAMMQKPQIPGQPNPNHTPSQPINCENWVKHTADFAAQQAQHQIAGLNPYASTSSMTETSSDTLASSLPESDQWTQYGFYAGGPLTLYTDMLTVVRYMNQRGSGLDVRDRQWLKMHIPRACIGSDLVDWLHSRVQGLDDRRDARRYGASLLKAGFIRHTTDKAGFSEQCYYTFTDPVQQQQAQAALLKNADGNLPPNLNHLAYGATHLAADAQSLRSDTSSMVSGSTIKDYPQQQRLPPGVSPSIAHQAGWQPAPSVAQHLQNQKMNGHGNMPHGNMQNGNMMQNSQQNLQMSQQDLTRAQQMAAMQQLWHHDSDTQSIISMSSSISQQHLKLAAHRMEKRQKKKLSKSAQSVGYKTQSGSGSSNSSASKNALQNKSHPENQSIRTSNSDGNNRTGNGSLMNDIMIPDNISEASTITSTKKLLPAGKPLGYQPAEITASRLSFQYAMANPMLPPSTPTPSQFSQASSSFNNSYRPHPQKYQVKNQTQQHSNTTNTTTSTSAASNPLDSVPKTDNYIPPPPKSKA